jgi:hypothetical protein
MSEENVEVVDDRKIVEWRMFGPVEEALEELGLSE